MELIDTEKVQRGLVRCPVCGREAKCVQFGIEGKGIWIGCDRSVECSRYIEIHLRGWSVEETARDWNRRNSGMCLAIRRLKKWFRDRFGAKARDEKRNNERKERERHEKEEKLKELFGAK